MSAPAADRAYDCPETRRVLRRALIKALIMTLLCGPLIWVGGHRLDDESKADRRLLNEGLVSSGVVEEIHWRSPIPGSEGVTINYSVTPDQQPSAVRFYGSSDYEVGALVAIYYDPNDPERAITESGDAVSHRDPIMGTVPVLVGFAFLVIGPCILWRIRRVRRILKETPWRDGGVEFTTKGVLSDWVIVLDAEGEKLMHGVLKAHPNWRGLELTQHAADLQIAGDPSRGFVVAPTRAGHFFLVTPKEK